MAAGTNALFADKLAPWEEFAGVPRDVLEGRVRYLCQELRGALARIEDLEQRVRASDLARRDADMMAETLRAAQAAGTALRERLDALGQIFPHWTCAVPGCGAFNGEAKEQLTRCRVCGADRSVG